MIGQVKENWDRHWFAPEPALNLAVARVLAATIALWVLLSGDRAGISGLPIEFWAAVRTSTQWRYLLFPGHESLERAITWLTAVLLLGALVGVRPRVCAFTSALLLYHLAPLESLIWSSSPQARGLTLATLALLVCGVAPSGDALSVHRDRRGDEAGETASWQYGWPLRLIQLWLVTVYFFSGIAKLRSGGLGWATAENLGHWFLFLTQNELTARFHLLGTWMADQPVLTGSVAVGTLLFELASPLVLVRRRLRPWFAMVALLFHAGIFFTMNIALNSWPLLLVFLDWAAMRRRFLVRHGAPRLTFSASES